jgi:hypothetical protein
VITTPRLLRATVLAIALASASLAQAQGSSSGSSKPGAGHSGGSDGSTIVQVPAAVSSGWARYYPFYTVTATPSGIVYTYVPQPFGVPPVPQPVYDRGTVAPLPPAGMFPPAEPQRPMPVVKVRRGDANRAAQMLTLGDRMFRLENWKRAEERYLQAARLDPGSAAPRVRLAQIALVREQYREAADRLREAEIAQPGWLINAPDIQSIYAEPSDFARRLAKLESYLHTHPDDRDGWLVLGAQWYLSGRAGRAADVFLRLSDPHRRPDVLLTAFLDATNQKRDVELPPRPVPVPPEVGDPFKAHEGEP